MAVPAAPAASVPEARAHAWYLQARVAEGLGDHAMAARGMGWAERLDHNDPELTRLLVAHAVRAGDHEAALEHALDGLDATPDAAPCDVGWAHRAAADAWLALGHSGDARAHLDRMADAGCPHPGGEVAWAHRTGDPQGARAALHSWDPTTAPERLDAAGWALRLSDPDQALRWLAPLAGHPGWPDAARLLGEVAADRPVAVRALLTAVADRAGPPWTDVLAALDAP